MKPRVLPLVVLHLGFLLVACRSPAPRPTQPPSASVRMFFDHSFEACAEYDVELSTSTEYREVLLRHVAGECPFAIRVWSRRSSGNDAMLDIRTVFYVDGGEPFADLQLRWELSGVSAGVMTSDNRHAALHITKIWLHFD